MSALVETLSLLSSLHDECKSENYIEPHYKEWYRVAIDALIEGGITAYQEFLANERATEFLAENEVSYITNHIQKAAETADNSQGDTTDDNSSSGTYWPMESDVEAPNLDLGWPFVAPGHIGPTDINLYFHPPRGHPLTIKEMVRKMIKEARKVIAIVMDMFTDIDIFREVVEASTRGVPVYLLLDDVSFPHFLKMAEKQGIQVQRFRNMRVRTVKGQDYISKSGAKFCGKMEQKFLLVDCEKVMYGTYSFMWSFEKVHLSMIQVITGKLVEAFDEEFRTLYARSCVPAAFGPEESIIGKHKKIPWENGSYSYQNSISSLLSASSQRSLFGRKDQMHTLDSTFLKARSRFINNEDDKFITRNLSFRGYNAQNKINQVQQFDRNDNWKRHSYAAGEKTESSPYLMLNRAVNNRMHNPQMHWNRQPDIGSIGSASRGGYSSNYNGSTTQNFANQLSQRITPNLSERNSSIRRSFHGTDNHVRSVQQRMPTLEHTTKSFLRNWRIESYLNDHSDIPPDTNEIMADRIDSNEGVENAVDNQLYSHTRIRSSILYKSTLPEQKETRSCTTNSSHSNSTIVDSQGSLTPQATPSTPQCIRFPESQDVSNFTRYDTPHMSQHHDVLKRHSLQVPDNTQFMTHGLHYNTNPGPSSYLYTSLSKNRQTDSVRNPNDNILKRRSLPLFESRKVNLGQSNNIIPPNYIYNSLVKRQTENPAPQNPTTAEKLENSSSQVNEKVSIEPPEPVKGAVSTESLDEESNKDSPGKKESKGSPSFLKKGSKKLKSLLNLAPDKKETLSKNKAPAFYRMCSSSDTLISEDDDQQFPKSPKKSETKNDSSPKKEKAVLSTSQMSLNKSKENVGLGSSKSNMNLADESRSNQSSGLTAVENKFLENTGDASAPRFNTEQIQFQDTKVQTNNNPYGRTVAPTIHRELSLRHPKETIHRELSQREVHHGDIPPMLQREMHLRHSQHRDMHHKDFPHRDINRIPSVSEFPKPQEDSSHSHTSDRRVYSRFEPFYRLQNNMPTSNPQNSTHQVLDFKNKSMVNNAPTYSRPQHVSSYASNVYNSPQVQPNENKFGRFMQKFGSFIHKKQ
ncbi:PREDICTED: protein FAM83B [Nanorana parkeri]|uniref:protein FAM83B n=1 Tax=Nanorana parkeri TaxID=125878 RepID=UPI000854DD5F|nr:PREDICTED: protein FAM83B [Nanorana parkeri]